MKKKIFGGLIGIALAFTSIGVAKAEEVYGEAFNKFAPNGVLTINAIKPTNEEDLSTIIDIYVANLVNGKFDDVTLSNCNEDYTVCTAKYSEADDNGKYVNTETHEIKIVWEEIDAQVQKIVENYAKNISEYKKSFALTDLNLINYYNHGNLELGSSLTTDALNHIPELKGMVNYDSHVSFEMLVRMGDAMPIFPYAYGTLVICYDNVMYKPVDGGISFYNIVYISEDTKDTSADYITAAKARIKEYLGHENFEITVAGTIEELRQNEDVDILGDSLMGNNYYNIKIGNVTYNTLIVRDDSKLEKPKFTTSDNKSSVSIKTTSSEVPLDTVVTVSEVAKESEEHKEIVKTLGIEEFKAFDISLYSESEQKNIKKLENGYFEVTVALGKDYVGKDLIAYYIDKENNKVDKHDVTLDEAGNATFKTNHFSTYIIAEKKNENTSVGVDTPATGDNILIHVGMLLGSLTLLGTMVILKKKM